MVPLSSSASPSVHAAGRTHVDLNRVHARADAENTASQRVVETVGMTKEGVHRLSRVERGEAFDQAWYSILREEWSEGRPVGSPDSREEWR